MGGDLVLRDIHVPPAPAWWPPAPGWWLVAAILIVLVLLAAWLAVRRHRRRRAITALFDRTLAGAPTPSAQVAAMSELLRRAARRHHPQADRLSGMEWLALLDQQKAGAFSQGPGQLLLEGGFRPDVDAEAVARLRPLARQRYLAWMSGKP